MHICMHACIHKHRRTCTQANIHRSMHAYKHICVYSRHAWSASVCICKVIDCIPCHNQGSTGRVELCSQYESSEPLFDLWRFSPVCLYQWRCHVVWTLPPYCFNQDLSRVPNQSLCHKHEGTPIRPQGCYNWISATCLHVLHWRSSSPSLAVLSACFLPSKRQDERDRKAYSM